MLAFITRHDIIVVLVIMSNAIAPASFRADNGDDKNLNLPTT